MNYNRIGKFLSLVLVKTQDLFTEVERHKKVYKLKLGVAAYIFSLCGLYGYICCTQSGRCLCKRFINWVTQPVLGNTKSDLFCMTRACESRE